MKNKDKTYDEVYSKSEEYKKHYSDIIYFTIWNYVMSRLNKNDKILDLGCGPGHLSNLLYDNGFNYYIGVDFSEIAISMAKDKVPIYNFIKSDLYNFDFTEYADFKFISIEVFEHLDDDILFIKKLPKSNIIFSVPNYMCSTHYRVYTSDSQIRDYYKDVLDIIQITPFSITKDKGKKIFVIEAKIKN